MGSSQLRVCRPEPSVGSTRLWPALWVALLRQLSVVLRQQHAAAVPGPTRSGQHEHRQPNRDPESGPDNRVNLGHGAWRGGEYVAGAERAPLRESDLLQGSDELRGTSDHWGGPTEVGRQ